MANTRVIKHECVTLRIENRDCVPALDLCRWQFTASAISIEVQGKTLAVYIFYLHLQTKECGEVSQGYPHAVSMGLAGFTHI